MKNRYLSLAVSLPLGLLLAAGPSLLSSSPFFHHDNALADRGGHSGGKSGDKGGFGGGKGDHGKDHDSGKSDRGNGHGKKDGGQGSGKHSGSDRGSSGKGSSGKGGTGKTGGSVKSSGTTDKGQAPTQTDAPAKPAKTPEKVGHVEPTAAVDDSKAKPQTVTRQTNSVTAPEKAATSVVATARQVKSKASAAPSQDAIIADILARLAGSGLSSEDRQRLQNQLAAALAPYPGSGGNESGGWRIRREVAGLTSGFTAQDTSGAEVNVQALAAGVLPRLPTVAKTGDVPTVAITSSPVDTTAIYSAAVETAIRTSREAWLLADQASGARTRADAAQAAARDAAGESANAARALSDAQKAIDVIKQALADDTLSSAQRLNLLASRAGAEITLTEAIDEAAATESRAASAQAHALARTAEALAAEKTAVLAKTAAEAAEREKNRARNAAWPPLPPGDRAMATPRILVAGR